MTASKPEVVAWMWRDINGDVQFNYMHPNGEPLIRLTEHERLQAEAERLQAARAADKARIAELEVLLSKCAPVMRAHAGASHMIEGFRPKRNQWDELVEAIDAALSQQGKENADG